MNNSEAQPIAAAWNANKQNTIFVTRDLGANGIRSIDICLTEKMEDPYFRYFDAYEPEKAQKCAKISLLAPRQVYSKEDGIKADWDLDDSEIWQLIAMLEFKIEARDMTPTATATDTDKTGWEKLLCGYNQLKRKLDSKHADEVLLMPNYKEMLHLVPTSAVDGRIFDDYRERDFYDLSLSKALNEGFGISSGTVTYDTFFEEVYLTRRGVRLVEWLVASDEHNPYIRIFDACDSEDATKCARLSLLEPRQIPCSDCRLPDWQLDNEEIFNLIRFFQPARKLIILKRTMGGAKIFIITGRKCFMSIRKLCRRLLRIR